MQHPINFYVVNKLGNYPARAQIGGYSPDAARCWPRDQGRTGTFNGLARLSSAEAGFGYFG
jgi:hypothetical protein